jgi:hypothetical protein
MISRQRLKILERHHLPQPCPPFLQWRWHETDSVSFDTETEREERVRCDGAFVAIGQVPDNERFANVVDLKKASSSPTRTMATKDPRRLCRRRLPRQKSPPIDHRLQRWSYRQPKRLELRLQKS